MNFAFNISTPATGGCPPFPVYPPGAKLDAWRTRLLSSACYSGGWACVKIFVKLPIQQTYTITPICFFQSLREVQPNRFHYLVNQLLKFSRFKELN